VGFQFRQESKGNESMRTYGQTAGTTGRALINMATYRIVRAIAKQPTRGWLHSRWHWYRHPFSLRGRVLWSEPLQSWFSPEDESAMECMFNMPSYEPVGWVSPKAGDIVIDIGAYIGWYAIQSARAVAPSGRVIALEPDAANRRQLDKNLLLNGISNCEVIPMAAWSVDGTIGWHTDDVPVWRRVDGNDTSASIQAVSVDSLVSRLALPRVDWIKMDIEGGEIEALKGAEGVLKRFHPALFIEIHETLEPVSRFLAGLGYSLEKSEFDEPPDHHGWILAR
jgi:FkbM family methyltransferase